MLSALRVENLAIIDRVEVSFEPGLTVITGETGAGKSILVHALNLVLGARASPEIVRNGTDRTVVEALFEVRDDPAVRQRLHMLDLPESDEIVIRRIVNATGRSRTTVNGALTTQSQLVQLSAGLVDISSQHEHQSLTDPANHLATLDAYAARPELVQHVRAAVERAMAAAAALEDVHKKLRERAEREDLLRFQLAEITKLNPAPGELPQLEEELTRMRHTDRLREVTSRAEHALYGRERALCDELARVESELSSNASLDPALGELAERIASARVELEDVSSELSRYGRRLSADPEELARSEERLHALKRLARRHGGDLEAAIAWRKQAEEELDLLSDADALIAQRSAEAQAAVAQAAEVARALSVVRRGAARALGEAIARELSDLGMGGAEIVVDVAPLDPGAGGLVYEGARLTHSGMDRVELLIAPNPGEPPRPLRRIASGGELSRALLGTKRVLAGIGPVGTYVFDEVDTGVGGAVADAIGRKLAAVARHHQVLCITHQPQIAAFGGSHLVVYKEVVEGRTASRLRRLSPQERVEELARMLGGRSVSDAARGAAEALLGAARVG
jgi:DNA repair protein RecN (Recombination protein N)